MPPVAFPQQVRQLDHVTPQLSYATLSHREKRVAKVGVLALLALAACGSDRPPTPLYPDPGRMLAANEVATLHGDVRDVDGRVVSRQGGTFALLPGCHVVGVVESWGRFEPQGGGVVAKIPRAVFVMPMRGGYRYVVKVDANPHSSGQGSVTIAAHEQDAEGNITQRFTPFGEATCPE